MSSYSRGTYSGVNYNIQTRVKPVQGTASTRALLMRTPTQNRNQIIDARAGFKHDGLK